MSRPVGSKNTVYLPTRCEGGIGAVNFWMSILLRAKLDVFKCPDAREMVESFVKHFGITLEEYLGDGIGSVDPLAEAWWIRDYVYANIGD